VLPEVVGPLDPAAVEDTAAEEFDESPDDPHAARTTKPAVSIDAMITVERLKGFLSSVVLQASRQRTTEPHLPGGPTPECASMINAQHQSRRLATPQR